MRRSCTWRPEALRGPMLAVIAARSSCSFRQSPAAQAVTGTLLGNVTDSSGGAVPGATVTATEVGKNISRNVVTNETGYYISPACRTAPTRWRPNCKGSRRSARQNVKVDVNTTVRVDLALRSAQMTEEVTVVGREPVAADRPHRHRPHHRIEDGRGMPLTFNRNFQSMLITVPGATRPHREHSAFFNSQDSLSNEVNGQSRHGEQHDD